MDRQVTISAKALLVVGLMAFALVGAYLVGSGHGQPASASDSSGLTRTVTVVGEGHVSVVPDQLTFNLGVDLTRSDLDTALGDTNTAMQHVIDTLTAQGVAKKDISTTDLEMNPVYARGHGQPPAITGYEVTQTITVVVEDLTNASKVVTAAVEAGGTGVQLNGLQLQVGDPDAALKPARTAAYQQAKAKAEEYAADAGSQLGEVVKVSEISDQPVFSDSPYASADSASAPAGVPIQPGQDQLTAQVTVVFALQ
jgi:uncharacterized protein YggE